LSPYPGGGENGVFLDFNPTIVALLYIPAEITGFGIGAGYERDLGRNFGAMADTSYMGLSVDGGDFRLWNIGLHARYMLRRDDKKSFIVSAKIGALLYDSPYFKGGTFLAGLELSWRKILWKHFLLEPYVNVTVCADDRYLMPFSVFALTEVFIPGFTAGVRLGFAF
jgi:hypothetical protein